MSAHAYPSFLRLTTIRSDPLATHACMVAWSTHAVHKNISRLLTRWSRDQLD